MTPTLPPGALATLRTLRRTVPGLSAEAYAALDDAIAVLAALAALGPAYAEIVASLALPPMDHEDQVVSGVFLRQPEEAERNRFYSGLVASLGLRVKKGNRDD